jgi:hypothetical protein
MLGPSFASHHRGCRAVAGGRAARGYGAAPPASRLLRTARLHHDIRTTGQPETEHHRDLLQLEQHAGGFATQMVQTPRADHAVAKVGGNGRMPNSA